MTVTATVTFTRGRWDVEAVDEVGVDRKSLGTLQLSFSCILMISSTFTLLSHIGTRIGCLTVPANSVQ